MDIASITGLLRFDPLAAVMIALVGFIGAVVASFASRYLKGDTRFAAFFAQLAGLVGAVACMAAADNMLVVLAAWAGANLLLVRLMVHKASWAAARASGALAARTFLGGFGAIAAAIGLLYAATGQTAIAAIIDWRGASPLADAALVLLVLGAMTQSALWPFNRWLLSSLNSPTPVSAIMHAGLVNGGGFLLARFAPLYLERPALLGAIFVIGLLSALAGTLLKLMQSDVKRMLACSTMGQMGFMFVQCGLGLFPAAIAHLAWHGLFKAYLFLASGGAAQEKRLDLAYPPSLRAFAAALACGIGGGLAFALASGKAPIAADTSAVLVVLAGIAGAQLALPMVRQLSPMRVLGALVATTGAGAAYGLSVHAIEAVLAPMQLAGAQPLGWLYLGGLAALVAAWLGLLFFPRRAVATEGLPEWMLALYARALNAGQPHPATVTAHRNHYSYR